MAYNPQNPNGQATMANSEPVVIASDQSAVPVSGTITANLSATDNAVLDQIELNTDPLLVVGGGLEATAIRVTLANDSTGVLSIDDNGGAITVDGTVAVTNADITSIKTAVEIIDNAISGTEMQVDVLTMPTVTINSPAVTNAGTFVVQENGAALTALQLIDDPIATLGTTTYTEAATKGMIIGAIRRDADTTLVDTTNEVTPLQVDANGRLKVEVFSGEALPVTLTSTTVTGTVAVTQSGTWDEVGINDSGNSITVDNPQLSVVGSGTEATAMRVTIATDSTGVLSIDDNGGNISIDDGGNIITVDGTVSITANSAINVAQINGVTPLMGSGATGTGSLRVTAATDSPEVTALQIMDDWDNGASDGASVSGDVAHDTVDAGEPVKIGMKAYELDGTAPQTAVAEADRVNAIGDLVGRQYVATEHPRFWHVSADYASAQTNTSVQASPGAGLALYITDIMISNGATAGNITLLNGSAGTVLFEIYPAVNGGVALNLKNPIKLSDATALCITSTTVTTHSIFVSGFID